MRSKSGARVLLVQPWNYHDENVAVHQHEYAWRNGPYNIILLATILRNAGYEARIADLSRQLIGYAGDVAACLKDFSDTIEQFRPDVLAVSFFSIHYLEVQKLVAKAREVAERLSHTMTIIAGGIHATVSPESCVRELGFDFAFVGEGDLGLLEFVSGSPTSSIQGLVSKDGLGGGKPAKGRQVADLNALPFPDWQLVDHRFYAYPSFARLGFQKTGTLDLVMGRGCVYDCSFCAYQTLSSVRFYSAEYLVEQMVYMHKTMGIVGFYFTDSTIGNNRKVLNEMCEILIKRDLHKKFIWLANIRSNQINETQLKLMWEAGCRYLLYGFESNSQRVLDLMNKKCSVESNVKCAELHNKLMFPYNASMLFGYPGETEPDLLETIKFITRFEPPSIGINWYVPLPGSPDYDDLRARGVINTEDPEEWRRIGEVNSLRCYADMPEARFRELYNWACHLAYAQIPARNRERWIAAASKYLVPEDSMSNMSVFKNVYSHIPRRPHSTAL